MLRIDAEPAMQDSNQFPTAAIQLTSFVIGDPIR